jgi:putative flippase GtrA
MKTLGTETTIGTRSEASRMWRYLVAGFVAAGANYGSRFLFSRWVVFELAVTLAFFVGLLVGFLLMRHYAFEATQGALGKQALLYGAVNALALLQTLVISIVLARYALPALGFAGAQRDALAHAVGVAVPVMTSYFGHRWGTFR